MTRRPRIRPGIEMVEVDGEAVLLDRRTRETHQLNATGTVLWYALDGTRTVDELAMEFGRAFDADETEVRGHIESFVDALDESGLLEGSGGD